MVKLKYFCLSCGFEYEICTDQKIRETNHICPRCSKSLIDYDSFLITSAIKEATKKAEKEIKFSYKKGKNEKI